eukprot:GEMP01022691.1.p1 GENE.GEMP01022691.1~~GEMP01022691.1.p1  ORF type:complete len:299 (+),score=73.69 GEMP01022691.1:115-1011(+)
MDKYRRVAKEKNTKETPEDEIRVTASGRTAAYVTYAAKLFNDKDLDKCTIKATGTALATAVTIVEIIKRRFKGLHQLTILGSTEIVDEYEPLEEGLDKVSDVRQVSFIEVTLSKTALDGTDKGYQPPISEDLVKEFSPDAMARGRGGRGGRRGGSRPRKGKGKGKSEGRFDSPPPSGGKKGKGKGKGKGKKGTRGTSPEPDRSESRGKKGGKEDRGKSNKGGKERGGKGSKSGKGKSSAYDSYGSGGYDGDGYGGKGYGRSYGYEEDYGMYGRKGAGKGGNKGGNKGKGKGKFSKSQY